MKKDNVSLFVIASVVLLLLLFFVPRYGWELRAWLSPRMPADTSALQAQNQTLEAQLAVLQSVQAQLPTVTNGTIRAMVYSSYPFNFKNEIVVNAGTAEGVAVGDAVTFQTIFIGTVQQTFAQSAVVDTVFDGNFRMPVRIGAEGYDALFEGGTSPMAVSIAKGSVIAAGDIVMTAASGTPYGLAVATVSATSTSADALFQQASLTFAYDMNDIRTVAIIRQ